MSATICKYLLSNVITKSKHDIKNLNMENVVNVF